MRVLHVIGPMSVGGAQTQLLGLVRAAHGRNWEATVCATSPGPMVDEFRALGVDVHVLRRLASPGLGRMLRLRRIVSAGRFDVVHGNLWQSNAYSRVAVVLRRHRPGVVISERNVEADRARLPRWVDRALAPVTDAWVGNTEAVCDFTRAVHPTGDRPVVMIPNAVDEGIFHPGPPRPAGGVRRIGSIGRLDPEKGFDVLVEAVRQLTQDGSPAADVEVEVVGIGPLRAELEAQAAGLPVRFVGAVTPGRGVADFLRSLDAFVLPSTFREGRPNVVLEALACGVPCVATDIEGMRETVGDAAVLVPPADPAALARALAEPPSAPVASPPNQRSFADLADDYADLFAAAVAQAAGATRTDRTHGT